VIGVIANSDDACIAREFFEFFKTPWEFYRSDRQFDVVLSTEDVRLEDVSARLVVIYRSDRTSVDEKDRTQTAAVREGAEVSFSGIATPLYGSCLTFRSSGSSVLKSSGSGESVAYVTRVGPGWFARVGYDLFKEIRTLLTQGQPASNAAVPTLELHIAFLRDLIIGCGVPLVEIPPVPHGHSFIACLTHDVDHAAIRKHRFDATMFGFLYRATIASTLNAVRGRLSLKDLMTNWSAAARLPLVYLGLADDFWRSFDRYLDLEQRRPSTFFVIPFARTPGRSPNGMAPVARGAGYGVEDIAAKIDKLRAAGCEIALHGIDAWSDSAKGVEEASQISRYSSAVVSGVRMHWLYRDGNSPAALEEAGFSYDSTVGFNETVGYRAGTTQVFKPIRATRLLELPLHVMDTALFYPDYLGLTAEQAWSLVRPMLSSASRFGGLLTVNWHDRSIAPERLWGSFYVKLLDELTRQGALFCTADQAVSWFRMRRSVAFERLQDGGWSVKVETPAGNPQPGMRLRVHRMASSNNSFVMPETTEVNFTDTVLTDSMVFHA